MIRKYSFPPLASSESKILILGSLPGDESIKQQQYYAHKNNAFWRLIYRIFGDEPDADYTKRCKYLLQHKLALWDVCKSAQRALSADSKITDVSPNEIDSLLCDCPNIEKILLNGHKAEKEFYRYFKKISVPAVYVPSTSPAFASMTFEEKLIAWQNEISDFKYGD
ncbi:MAG: DNA-deoxyinosine glycosylase [Clostridiales bacterium]|nr:DNA-deoxyinosine glycosylase [Clostridiales bacterium]